jgi:hypothetical protein
MNHKSILITLLFIFFFTINVFAQTSVKAEVDKLSITTDENITYKLIITTSAKKIPAPQIPKFTGFNIISQSQSSQISLSQGNLKTLIVYVFILSPAQTGKLNIEAASVKIENETFSTETIEIEVKPGKAKPSPAPKQKPQPPQEAPSQTKKITL